jgi:fumarylacetoacetase
MESRLRLHKNHRVPIHHVSRHLRRDPCVQLSVPDDLALGHGLVPSAMVARAGVSTMHLPVEVGDYTDFYSSREHAYQRGLHVPRSSERALAELAAPAGRLPRSGQQHHDRQWHTDSIGPWDKRARTHNAPPVFGPTKQLDSNWRWDSSPSMANHWGSASAPQKRRTTSSGLVLFNDWSARDIQSWEYVPLGPFLAKNFASSMSLGGDLGCAWSRSAFRVPPQDPRGLPYLQGRRHASTSTSPWKWRSSTRRR